MLYRQGQIDEAALDRYRGHRLDERNPDRASLASLQVGQEQRSAMLLPYKNLAPPLSLRPIHHPNNISNFDVSSAFMWSMRSKMTSDPFKRHRYLIRPSQCQQ